MKSSPGPGGQRIEDRVAADALASVDGGGDEELGALDGLSEGFAHYMRQWKGFVAD